MPTFRSSLRAILLSLLIHGGVVFSAYLVCSSSDATCRNFNRYIDTRVAGRGPEVSFVLCEPPRTVKLSTDSLPRKNATRAAIARQIQSPGLESRLQPVPPPKGGTPARGLASDRPLEAPANLDSKGTAEEQDASAEFSAQSRTRGTGGALSGHGVQFFHIETDARSVVYVIDRSASMGPNGLLASAKRELAASLAALPSTTRFQIIVYNRRAEVFRIGGRTELVDATPGNKQEALALVNLIYAEGSTDHVPAISLALGLQPDAVFFLTDADDIRAEVVRGITARNHGRSIIHAIQLRDAARPGGDGPLQSLARYNRGTYRQIPTGL